MFWVQDPIFELFLCISFRKLFPHPQDWIGCLPKASLSSWIHPEPFDIMAWFWLFIEQNDELFEVSTVSSCCITSAYPIIGLYFIFAELLKDKHKSMNIKTGSQQKKIHCGPRGGNSGKVGAQGLLLGGVRSWAMSVAAGSHLIVLINLVTFL